MVGRRSDLCPASHVPFAEHFCHGRRVWNTLYDDPPRYDTPIQPGSSLGTITICYNWSPSARVAPFAKDPGAVLDLAANMQVSGATGCSPPPPHWNSNASTPQWN